MKTKIRLLKWLMVVILSAGSLGTWAQDVNHPNPGPMTVCLNSTESYMVNPTGGSTYTWSIIAGTGGAGSITGNGSNEITVNWTSPGTCTLQVVENTATCTGDPVSIAITVLPGITAGTATADQTICYNTTPAGLSATAPAGGTGTYTYSWEFSIDGGSTWTPIAGTNSLTYAPGALILTTMYHVVQTSGSCGSVTTNAVTITVYDQLIAGTATADQTICYNATPAGLSATAPAGGTGTYTYSWEFSTNNGTTWTPIAGTNSLTYAPGALIQTTMYHVVQTSGSCGSVTTNSVTIIVNGQLIAGTATADQTICYNATPAGLSATAPAGGTGSYTYSWEFSIDGGLIWTPIAGTNSLTYAPGALTQTTMYHVVQTSGSCGSVTTNSVTIIVNGQLIAGTATADQTICYNATPAGLSATAPAGGPGSYTYSWEFSINGGTNWTPIAGTNSLTYAAGALTQTTMYHVVQTSGSCGSVTTNSVTITVYDQLIAGTATADQTICYNATPAGLSVTAPAGGTGTYTYSWEFSTNNGATWTPIAGTNSLTYAPGALTQTTMYHVVQTSGSCGSVTTNSVTITVYDQLIAGTATADQTICYNATPAGLSVTAPAGGTGTYTYSWEFSTNNGTTWTPIAGTNSLTYAPGALTQTTMYHVVQTSGSCGSVTTNAVTITVNGQLIAGTATADQTICYNTTPAGLSATAPTGGPGSYTYSWEFSIDGGSTWTPIASTNSLTYAPGALTQTTMYHVVQTSGTCGSVTTNNVTITVQPQIVTSPIYHR